MLFERRLAVTIQPLRIARPGRVRQSSFNPDDILVDTHGRALTTMEYLNRADIYLGDASSQIYEFLVRPRPCLFFNVHHFDWDKNPDFAHWHAGRVLSDVDELGGALSNVFEDHDLRYRVIQQEMLDYTFDLTRKRSSDRAADVILKIAGASANRKPGAKRAQGSVAK